VAEFLLHLLNVLLGQFLHVLLYGVDAALYAYLQFRVF
jgi:hypothetical protein